MKITKKEDCVIMQGEGKKILYLKGNKIYVDNGLFGLSFVRYSSSVYNSTKEMKRRINNKQEQADENLTNILNLKWKKGGY